VPPSIIVRDSKSVVSRIQSVFVVLSGVKDQKCVLYDGEGGCTVDDEDLIRGIMKQA